jgi:hypothetical protein
MSNRCWDGVNLDSPDHKSHVAYPTAGPATFSGSSTGGACPSTHPVKIPQLMLEVCNVKHRKSGNQLIISDRLGYNSFQQQSRLASRRITAILPQHRRQHRLQSTRRLRLWLERKGSANGHGWRSMPRRRLRKPQDQHKRCGQAV